MATPLVSQLRFDHKRVRAVFLDRRWWLFASDVACCLEYPTDRSGQVRGDSLMLCMPRTARCQAPLLGGPGTDLVPLIASTAVIEWLRAHPTRTRQQFLNWLTSFARFDG